MISVKSQWNGQAAYATVRVACWEALQRMVVFYHSSLLSVLNVSADPQRVKGRGGKSRTVYVNPSKPGEAPHKRSGWLQRSIQYALDKPSLSAKVGITANARYGIFLELGTKRMAARPFLLVTLKKVLPQLKAIGQIQP